MSSGLRLKEFLGVIALGLLTGCRPDPPVPPVAPVVTATSAGRSTLEQDIARFCGACHKLPLPSSFPKDRWHEEVQLGINFFFESDKPGLIPPPQAAIVEYYRKLAPKEFTFAPMRLADTPSPCRFREEQLPPIEFLENQQQTFSAISFVDWDGESLWCSDMNRGIVWTSTPQGQLVRRFDGVCMHPAAVRQCDLDGNGQPDLLISDLGSFLPEDHNKGKVVWIRDFQQDASSPVTLLENIGRVADVQAFDVDQDGDQDIVVAEFGWHKTGGLHLLTNLGKEQGFRFESQKIDDRSGAIHVPVADLNGDGRLDFIALFSQQYEAVIAFLNEESGFRKVTLFEGPDPSFGSSGIQLHDLDADGDLDIIYTNGDTFDSMLVKPYHGISWLENQGDLKFVEHRIEALPGVHRALPADFDGDGDFDLVACALLPSRLVQQESSKEFQALIWLEQISPGEFQTRLLKTGSPIHAAMIVGDFDRDGDPDLAVGNFHDPAGTQRSPVTIFWNERVK